MSDLHGVGEYFDGVHGLGDYFEGKIMSAEDRERAAAEAQAAYWRFLRASTDDPAERAAIEQAAERYGA